MNAPVKKFISHTVKLTFVSYVCPLTKGSCARVNIHFGPLLQLLFHILPRRFGLKPQRVSHEVDAFFGAVDQRKISYKNREELMWTAFIWLKDWAVHDVDIFAAFFTHMEAYLQFWAPGISPWDVSVRHVCRGTQPLPRRSDCSPAKLKLASKFLLDLSRQMDPSLRDWEAAGLRRGRDTPLFFKA